jgi:hypothetical protein
MEQIITQRSYTAKNRQYVAKVYTPSEEELIKNKERLANTKKAVVQLTGEEFKTSNNIELIRKIIEFFEENGNNTYNEHLGDIELNKKGIKDARGHFFNAYKAAAFKALPLVLEKGKIIDYKTNYNNRNYDTAAIAAPVDIAQKRFYVKTIVIRNTDPSRNNIFQRFYSLAVYTKDKASELLMPATNH